MADFMKASQLARDLLKGADEKATRLSQACAPGTTIRDVSADRFAALAELVSEIAFEIGQR